MRRNLTSGFQPVSLRSGVIASVMQRNRSVQTPVSLVRSASGLALRLPVQRRPDQVDERAQATPGRRPA